VTEDIKKYEFIDALRGYAILAVTLVHASQSVPASGGALRLLAANGARGVQLFFIASALTLGLSWESRTAHERAPIRNFFLRRLFRIAPMFYVAICLYLLLFGCSPRYWAPNGIEWWGVLLTATFLNGYLPETITSVVPGGWSIAVEMNFYLVLPLLLRWFKTLRSRAILLLLCLIVSAAAKLGFRALYGPHFPPDQQYLVANFSGLNFLAQLPIFALGLIVQKLFKNPSLLRRVVRVSALLFLAFVAGAWLVRAPIGVVDNPICAGIGLAILTGFFAGYPGNLLVNRAVIRIGKISFSMYLTQFAVLDLLGWLGVNELFRPGDISSIGYYFCVVVITAAISYVSYRAIERPGVRLGKNLIDYLEERKPAVVQHAPIN
jgi:peptidoglycan/LPS O-acetylase OafA/YrhL